MILYIRSVHFGLYDSSLASFYFQHRYPSQDVVDGPDKYILLVQANDGAGKISEGQARIVIQIASQEEVKSLYTSNIIFYFI